MTYNPYAADGGTPDVETVGLDVVIRDAISAMLLSVHTCIPGKITKVKGNNRVDVQPLLQRKYLTGAIVNLPNVQDVPVFVPRGTDYWFKAPVAVDDLGILLICERSLDRWKVNANKGEPIDPKDNRIFSLTDGIFLPGLYGFDNQLPGDPADMILHNRLAEIFLKKNGTFKITNGTVELIDLIDQLTIQVEDLTDETSDLTSETTSIVSALLVFAGSLSAASDPIVIAAAAALLASLTPVVPALAIISVQLGNIASALSTIQTEVEELKA